MDSLSQFSLAGKRALVTGSSRGIGFAIAAALAGAGADVILNSRDPETLGKATADLAESGARARAVAFDVTSSVSVGDAVEFIERDIGPIDILVNNAGMQFRAPLEEFPEDKFERIMSTNVTSVYLVGQAVAKRMIPRGAGKIVNICSLMSGVARPSIAPYAASKAAVANLTRGMATEWARHGLNVNGIAPGYFKTELNEALVKDAEFSAWIGRRTPMGRWGEVAELGGAAIFLASDAASFVNGHILYVDGAFMATV
ncbi:MAG: gluconate 5-dehydrogenase [Devosia sp. 67-54]|uniref:glucose 1-dehydrogenase n=1 Tax=unclassified Devosia TaxID=196773 RepID=UPI000962BC8C|nr:MULTISPECIES: glucose 1-dehydrogenase [unclassified Devosia]MBN9306296.1 glucose 1-dehydrogenase [Devosia sp.]OJX18366.1 MAG: gluconate 5-dehydrogenase [Devosia sp. 67-54]